MSDTVQEKKPSIADDMKEWREGKSGDQPAMGETKEPSINAWDVSAISGVGEVYDHVRQMVVDLKAWKDGDLAWGDISPSLIIEGAPGTGKTYLARQVGKVLGKENSVITSFADWQSSGTGHLGTLLKAMKESFAEARDKAPSIMFIDEIDSLSSRNADDQGRNDSYWRSLINAFLAEMDVSNMEGVLVIGACNDVSGIDPAILRDGRFDETLYMELPGPEFIAQILENKLPDFNVEDIANTARMLTGETPAAIDGAVRKMKAECRRKKTDFSLKALEERLLPDPEMREAIWKRVSLHECGHAIAGKALGLGTVERVLMHAQGSGFAQSRLKSTEGVIEELDARLAMIMAGRAAEELCLGSKSSGAGGSDKSDLAKATQIALAIETRYGMGEAGAFYADLKVSDWHENAVSGYVKTRIATASERALDVLSKNQGLLCEMAADLADCRSMEGQRLQDWLDQVAPYDMTTDITSPILTCYEFVEAMEESSIRFSHKKTRASAVSAMRSGDEVVIPLLRIGYFYGNKRKSASNASWAAVCMAGYKIATKGLPRNAVMKVRELVSFSEFLLAKDEMAKFRELEEGEEIKCTLKEIGQFAQMRINLQEKAKGTS